MKLSERDLTTFAAAVDNMVSEVNPNAGRRTANTTITKYTKTQVESALETGNIESLRNISRYFFYRSGFYRRTMLYFSTHLKYYNIIMPQFFTSRKANKNKINKKYEGAVAFIDALNLEYNCPNIMTDMFIDGVYFAIFTEFNEREAMFRKLPPEYCRTTMQTGHGINILEFDMKFFDKIMDKDTKKAMLKTFPKIVQKGFRQYEAKGEDFRWVVVPPNEGVAFTIGDQRPPMISIIPSIINLEEYRGIDRERDEQDLERLLVQKMPIYEGELVFDLEEIGVLHKSVSKMLKGLDHVDLMTTFADVSTPMLKDPRQLVQDNLEKVEKSIFGEAGVSKEIFSPTRNLSLATSLQNDLSYVMSITQQISTWVDIMLMSRFDDKTVHFDFKFLPISYYNQKEMLEQYLKQAQSGYSKLLPAIAMGTSQAQLIGLLTFENDYLNIVDSLIPLQTSYTQSGIGSGRPTKDDNEREEKTDTNKESGNDGGGMNI